MSKETPLYLTKQLISYMGNKRKIVPYLEDIIVDIKQKLDENYDKLWVHNFPWCTAEELLDTKEISENVQHDLEL